MVVRVPLGVVLRQYNEGNPDFTRMRFTRDDICTIARKLGVNGDMSILSMLSPDID